jgi:hypothetical protein
VRYRRGGTRWHPGRVTRVERDGSIGITDANGGARAIPVERVEVRFTGRRGGRAWEPLADRVARAEQLRLL